MYNKNNNQKNRNPTYISLFSSAGVGCFGFKLNGFECIATNELIERRLEIQKNNQKCKFDTGYIQGDITTKEIQNKTFYICGLKEMVLETHALLLSKGVPALKIRVERYT